MVAAAIVFCDGTFGPEVCIGGSIRNGFMPNVSIRAGRDHVSTVDLPGYGSSGAGATAGIVCLRRSANRDLFGHGDVDSLRECNMDSRTCSGKTL